MTLFPSLRRIRSAPVALHRLHSVFACERRLIGQSKGTVQQSARTQKRINLLSFLRPVRSAPVALHRLRSLLEGQTRLEGAMSSTLRSMQSEAAQWAGGEPTARTTVRPRGSRIEWQPRAREPVLGRAPALFLIAFCAGVVATLAWQSYEAVPAVPSPDQEVLKAISLDLTGVRQRIDEIATQLTVGQEQMTRDITRRLEAAEKDVLDKIGSALPPRPTAAPARYAH
jgi:septum formation topological specificity factor MinE